MTKRNASYGSGHRDVARSGGKQGHPGDCIIAVLAGHGAVEAGVLGGSCRTDQLGHRRLPRRAGARSQSLYIEGSVDG